MSNGLIETLSQRARMPRSGGGPLPGMASPSATIDLLLAILASHRQTTAALYRLMRGLAEQRPRTPRRERSRRIVAARDIPELAAPRAVPADPPAGERSSQAVAEGPSTATPQLVVRCFGRFEVVRDGTPILHWRRGKAKTLFKYLVVRHQPVHRDVLLDLLWPEADPQSVVNGLRVTLHALRQTLGPYRGAGDGEQPYVICEGGNYRLNPKARLWVDADQFTAHFDAGRRFERQRQEVEAMRQYELAEEVYQDDYLVEDLYDDWTVVRREELKDQYLIVLTKLADHFLQLRDSEGCIVRCHRILQKDACREDAYQRLMRCYAQLGRRSQALRWYELCVRTLRQELDVAPSEQTVGLYHQIMAGKEALLSSI